MYCIRKVLQRKHSEYRNRNKLRLLQKYEKIPRVLPTLLYYNKPCVGFTLHLGRYRFEFLYQIGDTPRLLELKLHYLRITGPEYMRINTVYEYLDSGDFRVLSHKVDYI